MFADHVAHLVHRLLTLAGLSLTGLRHLHVVHHLLQGLQHLAGKFLLPVFHRLFQRLQHLFQILLGDRLLLTLLLLLLLLTVGLIAQRLLLQLCHVVGHGFAQFLHQLRDFFV